MGAEEGNRISCPVEGPRRARLNGLSLHLGKPHRKGEGPEFVGLWS